MSRQTPKHQRAWIRGTSPRAIPICWVPQRRLIFLPHRESLKVLLARLSRVWRGSGNFAAVFDALQVGAEQGIRCAWAERAIATARKDAMRRWQKRHIKDRIDLWRAWAFEEGRLSPPEGPGLSRPEACRFAHELLAGTRAAIGPASLDNLLRLMAKREAQAFGRYYQGAHSTEWFERAFPPTSCGRGVYMKWRQRGARREAPGTFDGWRVRIEADRNSARQSKDPSRLRPFLEADEAERADRKDHP